MSHVAKFVWSKINKQIIWVSTITLIFWPWALFPRSRSLNFWIALFCVVFDRWTRIWHQILYTTYRLDCTHKKHIMTPSGENMNFRENKFSYRCFFFHELHFFKKSRLYDDFEFLTLSRHFQGQGHRKKPSFNFVFFFHKLSNEYLFCIPTTNLKIHRNTKIAYFDLLWPLAAKILTLEKNKFSYSCFFFHELHFLKKFEALRWLWLFDLEPPFSRSRTPNFAKKRSYFCSPWSIQPTT